tara:strand:+ start:194 stop:493 length:300 start_codon:yes stop_codon:yes gene_type:complete
MMHLEVVEQPQRVEQLIQEIQEMEVQGHQMQLQEQPQLTLVVEVVMVLEVVPHLAEVLVELVEVEMEHIQVNQQKMELQTLVVAVEVVVKLVDHQVLQV